MPRDHLLLMPFGRYAGRPIESISDGGELAKFLAWPFGELLSPQQRRAIQSQLEVADQTNVADAAAVPADFVRRCRDAVKGGGQ